MLNEFEENDELPSELLTLHRHLLQDSEEWQTTVPSTTHLGQFVDHLADGDALPHFARQSFLSLPRHAPSRPVAATPQRSPHAFMPATIALLVIIVGAVIFHTLSMAHAPISRVTAPGAPATATKGLPMMIAPQPPNIQLPLPANGFIATISMATATDGWAVGGIRMPANNTANATQSESYFLHYQNGVWTRSPDSFPGVSIASLAMATTADGWAVGNGASQDTAADASILLHYTRGHWQQVAFPAEQGTGAIMLENIFMPSPTFGWLKGTLQMPSTGVVSNQKEIVFVYHDGRWSELLTPFAAWKGDISMVSADEGWAVNNIGHTSATFAHYLHGVWTNVVSVPNTFESLSMASSLYGWAVATGGGVFYHFNGSQWQQAAVSLPDPHVTYGDLSVNAFVVGQSDTWIASASEDDTIPGDQRQYTGALFHVTQDRWHIENLPVNHAVITAVVKDANGGTWALGEAENPYRSFILYQQRGIWTVYGQA